MSSSSAPSSTIPRLPGRTPRQRLTVLGITLTICVVFWAAILGAHHDPDPRLYERIVPVTIVPTPPVDAEQATAPKARPGPVGRSASGTTTG